MHYTIKFISLSNRLINHYKQGRSWPTQFKQIDKFSVTHVEYMQLQPKMISMIKEKLVDEEFEVEARVKDLRETS